MVRSGKMKLRNTVQCSGSNLKTCSGDEYDDHHCRFFIAEYMSDVINIVL